MKILAFDTTNSTLSIALLEDQKTLLKTTIKENGKQSEILITEIEEILKANKIWYQDLDFIAATSGPGSFTGVRIGLSTARALKISTNLPLILVGSLEVLAFKYKQKNSNIFVAIDAKMDEFFIGSFSKTGQQIIESQLIKSEDILNFLPKEKFFLCGSGKNIIVKSISDKKLNYQINDQEDIIEADLVGLLAYKKIHEYKNSPQNNEAVYLRQPKISKRKK